MSYTKGNSDFKYYIHTQVLDANDGIDLLYTRVYVYFLATVIL